MGSVIGVKIDFSGAKVESKEIDVKDDRKRNSLAFYISQYVEFEEDDFVPLIEAVKKDKHAKNGGKPPTIRNSSNYPSLYYFHFFSSYFFSSIMKFILCRRI